MNHSIIQWILYFYLYSLIGWIWETCYVSIRTWHITNRGFLKGPFLPIYGFGALTILIATLPVQNSKILTFFVGMMAATILEYVTGDVMEAIFKVRYWDYSSKRFHLNGHICLSSSIAWGVASLLLVNVIHVPVAFMINRLPQIFKEAAAVAISFVLTFDFAMSVREALDIKEVLMNLKQYKEEIQKLQKRLDVLIAIIDEEKQKVHIKNEIESIRERLAVFRAKRELRSVRIHRFGKGLLHRNPHAVSKKYESELREIKAVKILKKVK